MTLVLLGFVDLALAGGALTVTPPAHVWADAWQWYAVSGADPGAPVVLLGGAVGAGPCHPTAGCAGVTPGRVLATGVADGDGAALLGLALPRAGAVQAGMATGLSAVVPVTPVPVAYGPTDLGGATGCSVADGGQVVCWGDDGYGQARPVPGGGWATVSVGASHGCATDDAGGVACWGNPESGKLAVPELPLWGVTAGGHHSCGVDALGGAVCWGSDENGKATPPEDEAFLTVDAGGEVTCGLTVDGAARCWGDDAYGVPDTPAGPFVQVQAGKEHACARAADGRITCWGNDDYGTVSSTPDRDGFTAVEACRTHTCALDGAGEVTCWGDPFAVRAVPPDGPFVQIAVAPFVGCARRPDATVTCWGMDRFGVAHPP